MRTVVKVSLVLGAIFMTLGAGAIFMILVLATIFTRSAVAQQPSVQNDIVYATIDKTELKLDLVQPLDGNGPFPLVIWIHGGGWQSGDRKEHHGGMKNLATMGYVSASIEYRLAPKHQFPAQLDDARAALTYLRENANDYKIDPNRIGLIGGSAGGQLALLLGFAKNDGTPNGVKAIVNFAGPTDFRNWTILEEGEAQLRSVLKKDLNGMLKDYLGTSDREAEIMAEASPITYIKADNPPVLTIHGSADVLVPLAQATLLHDALKNANVPEKLFVVEGGGHGTFPPDKLTAALVSLTEFLDKNLKGK